MSTPAATDEMRRDLPSVRAQGVTKLPKVGWFHRIRMAFAIFFATTNESSFRPTSHTPYLLSVSLTRVRIRVIQDLPRPPAAGGRGPKFTPLEESNLPLHTTH